MSDKQNSSKEKKNPQNDQLTAEIQNLTQINRQVIAENEKLKKTKSKLEQQIVILSDHIVQMNK